MTTTPETPKTPKTPKTPETPETGATAVTPTAPQRPTWLTRGSLALAVVGLLVSAYLVFEHFTQSTTLACPANGSVDCHKVTQSSYSYLLGIPVAVLGLLWFVVVLAMCLPRAWRDERLDGPRLLLVLLGMGFVLYLVWAELFGIGAICLWCTVVHVVTAALFGLILLGWAATPRR